MNIDEKIKYWFELADYDYETAEAMLNSKRYLYVGFMCHQTIEKILKALFVKTIQEIPPKIHSLSILIKKIGIENEIYSQFTLIIDKLEPLNIEARYPTYKDELTKLLTKDYCLEIINETRQLLTWIKMKL
jgi:HEPN domain-containing protein